MLTVERYGKTRFWAVYEYGELLCVTVYKKGAIAVRKRLERASMPLPPTLKSESAALAN